MNCPDCNSRTSITDSRKTEDGETVRRRRKCRECELRFTTYERKVWDQLRVRKTDGTIQTYDQTKVRAGIEAAVEKRPVSPGQVAELTEQVTSELKGRDESVVKSDTIGAMVAERLREIDKVAYVRFSSVYQDYSEPAEFLEALDDVIDDGSGTNVQNDKQATSTVEGDQSQ